MAELSRILRGLSDYESDESSVESDIHEEHENGYHYNEYTRRYNLNIKTSTWNKDSQGLFDFETAHLKKMNFVRGEEGTLLRNHRD